MEYRHGNRALPLSNPAPSDCRFDASAPTPRQRQSLICQGRAEGPGPTSLTPNYVPPRFHARFPNLLVARNRPLTRTVRRFSLPGAAATLSPASRQPASATCSESVPVFGPQTSQQRLVRRGWIHQWPPVPLHRCSPVRGDTARSPEVPRLVKGRWTSGIYGGEASLQSRRGRHGGAG